MSVPTLPFVTMQRMTFPKDAGVVFHLINLGREKHFDCFFPHFNTTLISALFSLDRIQPCPTFYNLILILIIYTTGYNHYVILVTNESGPNSLKV